MDWTLELIQVPVTDVERAKAFYTDQAGFNADPRRRAGMCRGFSWWSRTPRPHFVCFGDPGGNGWAVQEIQTQH